MWEACQSGACYIYQMQNFKIDRWLSYAKFNCKAKALVSFYRKAKLFGQKQPDAFQHRASVKITLVLWWNKRGYNKRAILANYILFLEKNGLRTFVSELNIA